MPRKLRLSRADFAHSRGFKRVHGTLFSLSVGTIPNRGAGSACVVSTKVAKTAPKRNRLKRRVRSILFPLLKGETRVFIFIAKKGAADASFADIRSDVEMLLKKA